jgi:hypothetical protein
MPLTHGVLWSADELSKLQELADGERPVGGLSAMARKLGRTIDATKSKFTEQHGRYVGSNIRERTHFFDVWSHDVAYALGYIWSDGCITHNRISFGCVESDGYIPLGITKQIGLNYEQYIMPGGMKSVNGRMCDTQNQLCIRINNVWLVEQLKRDYGLCERKSFVNPDFPEVPPEFIGSFTRGVFDGDGTLTMCKKYKSKEVQAAGVQIAGSYWFLDGLAFHLGTALDILIPEVTESKTSSICKISWYRRSDVSKIYHEFYDRGGLRLERKYLKFSAWHKDFI